MLAGNACMFERTGTSAAVQILKLANFAINNRRLDDPRSLFPSFIPRLLRVLKVSLSLCTTGCCCRRCCIFRLDRFDGSGGDNNYDAGSCVDGRLTSAWNWCSKVSGSNWFYRCCCCLRLCCRHSCRSLALSLSKALSHLVVAIVYLREPACSAMWTEKFHREFKLHAPPATSTYCHDSLDRQRDRATNASQCSCLGRRCVLRFGLLVCALSPSLLFCSPPLSVCLAASDVGSRLCFVFLSFYVSCFFIASSKRGVILAVFLAVVQLICPSVVLPAPSLSLRQLEKRSFLYIFLLSGFSGFDGDFSR